MDKIKLLTYSTIGLLVLNLGILAFMFFGPPRGHRPPPDRFIIEKLDFDKEQVAAYQKIISLHRQQIRDADKLRMDLKDALYNQLLLPENERSAKDSLMAKIAENQKNIETINFNHFLDIQKICKKEQLPSFQALVKDFSRLFSPPPRH